MRNEVKLVLGAVLSITVGNAALLYVLTEILDRHGAEQLSRLRQEKNADIVNELKGRVESAHSVVAHLAATVADEEEAKRQSMASVSAMRFGEDNYIWVHRLDPERRSSGFMLVHAANNLVGRDLSGWIDLDEIARIHYRGRIHDKDAPEVAHIAATDIFAGFNEACLRHGEGTLAYYWPKIIDGKPTAEGYRKLSYVKYFPRWRWVIGAGAYADHIDAVVGERARQLRASQADLVRKVTAAIVAVSLVVIVIVAWMIRRLLLRPLYLRLSQTNRELAEACQAAAAATEAKSVFLANMSHEIRTPLNGILATAELLRHTELDDKQRRYVDTLSGSGRALLAVISDILDFSKIEAGKLRLELVPFQPRAVVTEVVELLSSEAERKGLALEARVGDEASDWFVGDPVRLRQILVNLVGNAVKFTEEGRVAIELRLVEQRKRRAAFEIAVTDTGIGIAEEEQARLFARFEQADATSTRRYGGTGLGLALSRQLAELMGGEISLISEPGKGSTFRVALTLPRTEARPFQAGPSLEGDADRDATIQAHVLLVEDNAVNREVASELLELLGATVDLACSGKEALDRLDHESYDVVFMDCHMPVMDGLEAARRIRDREADDEHVPIIAMSASATVADRERCAKAGMDAFLAKPLYLATLRSVLQEHASPGAAGPTRPGAEAPDSEEEDGSSTRVFDHDKALRIVGGNQALLRRIVAAFDAELPDQLASLEQAIDARELRAVAQAAHSLKGAAASVGGEELRALAVQVEAAAKAKNRAELDRLRPELRASADRLAEALSAATGQSRTGAGS